MHCRKCLGVLARAAGFLSSVRRTARPIDGPQFFARERQPGMSTAVV